jgi:hypothetical protein
MSQIVKYLGSFLAVTTVIILILIYIGYSNKGAKVEASQVETSEQYKVSFNFEGDKSQLVDLLKGKAEINLEYFGKSKFSARLLRSDGKLLATLSDGFGQSKQKHVIDIPETTAYILDIKTTGKWEFSRK